MECIYAGLINGDVVKKVNWLLHSRGFFFFLYGCGVQVGTSGYLREEEVPVAVHLGTFCRYAGYEQLCCL